MIQSTPASTAKITKSRLKFLFISIPVGPVMNIADRMGTNIMLAVCSGLIRRLYSLKIAMNSG